MEDLRGHQLGKYILEEEIGRGGMGAVYKSHDPMLKRPVAVKILAPHLVWEKEFVQRFLREAQSAALLRHNNIVTVYEVGQEGNLYYFVMEYVPGKPLSELVRSRGPLPLPEILNITSQMASALDYAHGEGVIHRDIKSSNIIVDERGRAVLTDFGIARAAEGTRLTSTGVTMGTPEYMAPEQAQGEEATAASDLYSLGVIVYEMLVGKVPFSSTTPLATMMKHVTTPPPSVRQKNRKLSEAVEQVVQWVLSKDPQARPASGAAFVQALDDAIAGKILQLPAVSQVVSTSEEATAPVVADAVPVIPAAGDSGAVPPTIVAQRVEDGEPAEFIPAPAAPDSGVVPPTIVAQRVDGSEPPADLPAPGVEGDEPPAPTPMPTAEGSEPPPVKVRRPARRVPVWMLGLAGVAVLALAGGLAMVFRPDRDVEPTPWPSQVPTSIGASTLQPAPSAQPTAQPPVSTVTPVPSATPGAWVSSQSANVRSGPGVEYDRIGRLVYGDQVQVIAWTKSSVGERWLLVRAPEDLLGWVASGLLVENDASGVVPEAATVPPTPVPVPTQRVAPTNTVGAVVPTNGQSTSGPAPTEEPGKPTRTREPTVPTVTPVPIVPTVPTETPYPYPNQ